MILYPQTRAVSSLLPSGTTSFRLASRKLFGEWGLNSQNINADSLSIFIPARPDYEFTQADQRGAEALVVAYDSPAGRYRRLFELDIKVHTYVALIIFQRYLQSTNKLIDYTNIALEDLMNMPHMTDIFREIKAHPSIYDIAKRIVHGSSYLLGPRTMQKTILKFSRGLIRLTQQDCSIYQSIFFALFPEIRAWHKMVEVEARKTGELRNLFGHPRKCEQIFTQQYIRELISWKPQSSVAEITHNAAVYLDRSIRTSALPWYIVNNKHDSLTIEHPKTDRAAVHSALTGAMEQTLTNAEGVSFTMRAECKSCDNLSFTT